MSEPLYEGARIDLELEEGRWYRGRVLRPTLDGNLIVVFERGTDLPEIPLGKRVNALWVKREKLFGGEVEVRGKGGKFAPFVEITSPFDLKPLERRRHKRVKVMVPIEYRKVDGGLFKATRSLDISGGGVKLIVDEDLAVGDELELLVYLPESDVISALGRVVRVETSEGLRTAGVEFMIMDERKRRDIINFVFKSEMKERQRAK